MRDDIGRGLIHPVRHHESAREESGAYSTKSRILLIFPALNYREQPPPIRRTWDRRNGLCGKRSIHKLPDGPSLVGPRSGDAPRTNANNIRDWLFGEGSPSLHDLLPLCQH